MQETQQDDLIFDFELPPYIQQYLRSTTTHVVRLLDKNGEPCLGVYNGLSYWGRVFDNQQQEIYSLCTDEEYDEEGVSYLPNFTPEDFVKYGGFTLVKN